MERHASRIADSLGIDPMEWRKENALNRKRPLAIGVSLMDQGSLDELLDTAATMGDYRRKWASYELLRSQRRTSAAEAQSSRRWEEIEGAETLRGIGIAAAYQGSGFLHPGCDEGVSSVELTLDKESRLEIKTSMIFSSRDYADNWRRIAAEILSLEAENVRIVQGDTDQVPDSGPACLSRNITTITRLVERSCVAIRKQRFRDPLPITIRRPYYPLKVVSWDGHSDIDQNSLGHPAWAAAVVELEIDPLEYQPKVRGVHLAIEAGRLLSEPQARRSIKFQVIQALAWASGQKLEYVEGKIPRRFFNYEDIPKLTDIPPISIDFIWNESASPKGIGELPFNCVPAAYAQAVSQAVDHPFSGLPISSRDIWDAEKQKKNEEQP
jgi:CO/xanthine dehydrogenase Mo-binding subunit